VFTAATLPTSQAYISDTTTGKDRAKGFGLLGASFGLGFAMGPPIGSLLYTLGISLGGIGYEAPAIFAAILAAINLLGAIAFLPESLTPAVKQQRAEFKAMQESMRKQGTKVPVFSRMIVALIVVFAVISLGFSSMESTLILFGQSRFNLDATLSGFVFLVVGGITILTQGAMIRPLSNRFSDGVLISTGLAIAVLGFLGITTVYTLWELTLWVVPLSFGTSLALPTLNSLLSKTTPEGRQGAVLGVNQGMGSLMRIVGPLAATYLLSIDVAYPYYASASLIALAFILTLSIVGRSRKLGAKTTLCTNCGARLQEGAAYCSRCGFPSKTDKPLRARTFNRS
jgi:DHA1 family tetracycline resistance protein-like MFS transporter